MTGDLVGANEPVLSMCGIRCMWGRMRPAAVVLMLVLCSACERADPDVEPAASDGVVATAPAPTPGGAERVPPREPRHFDPGTLSIGDTVLGLRVVRLDVARVFEDSVWSGSVQFAGEITLTGTYEQHFDYPEVDAVCFQITDSESINRIPEFAPDPWTSPNQRTWFCFTNAGEVRVALGSGTEPRTATVVVDDYTNQRIFSDAFDTARLVRVVRNP